eukprot:6208876-Pleurochrysis_carterae.AAC.1
MVAFKPSVSVGGAGRVASCCGTMPSVGVGMHYTRPNCHVPPGKLRWRRCRGRPRKAERCEKRRAWLPRARVRDSGCRGSVWSPVGSAAGRVQGEHQEGCRTRPARGA